MLDKVREYMFQEPAGRQLSLIWLAMAVFASLFVIQSIVFDSSLSYASILLIIVFTLLAIAEGLPKNRQLLAGVCRIAVLLVGVFVLLAWIFAPDFLTDERLIGSLFDPSAR